MYLTRLFIGIMTVLAISSSVFAASSLEKSQWRVELTEEGSQVAQFIDKVTFSDGKINSAIFERKGFPPSSYDSTEKGDNIAWEAKQQGETDGNIGWQGELQGDAMTGTLVWKKPDGKTVKYAIMGSPILSEESAAEAAESATSAVSQSVPAIKGWFEGWFGCSLVR